MTERRVQPTRPRPSVLVEQHRDELLQLAADCGLSNVDVLAHLEEEYRKQPFRIFSFVVDAEDLLGISVDLVFDHSTGPAMPAILAEAVPL